jgi:predicted dehydrogenase
MSKRTLGIGIVGFGWMGKTHAHAYRSLPYLYADLPFDVRFVGVCVRRAETIDDAVKLGGFEFGTTDFDELVARDDIDVINVCTPNQLHADQVVAALNAGKHVYCDKPLAVTHEDCQRIMAACRADLVTQVALQYRFYPCTMKAKRLMDGGRIGTLLSFRSAYLHASLIDPDKPISWRQLPGAGGGALNDLGSHLLDLLGWFVGPFAAVYARQHTHMTQRRDANTGELVDVAADDMAVMMLRTASGAVGTVEVSKLATGCHDELRIELHGDKGAIRLNLLDPNWLEFHDLAPGSAADGEVGFKRIETIGHYPKPFGNMLPGKLNIGWLSAHAASLYNFLGAICGTETAHPTFADSTDLQRVLDIAHASSQSGKWTDV